ncbi:MAG: HesA/MoeB/ThiF family protein [Solirubrobacteraceae bacterium]
MRSLSVAMTESTHELLRSHLLRADGQEDLCFVLYRPSTGSNRSTALIREVVLPSANERNVHGNASFNATYFLRALQLAEDSECGLGLAHSHPAGSGWQGMSPDDVDAERAHAGQAWAVTDLPLLGLTLAGDDTWSARNWTRSGRMLYERHDCDSVRIIGERLRVSRHPQRHATYSHDRRMIRTVSAWGEAAQQELSGLHVGIVGVGSVGMLVAEGLARTGIRKLTLLDFDSVQLHNLDRLAHATRLDATSATSKVDVAKKALEALAPVDDLEVRAIPLSIVELEGFMHALDCDVLFSCVDRPWPRQLLDHAAFAHLIPVVDGGISVGAIPRFTRADWKVQISAPARRCLECCGQYLPADVALERSGDLDDPSYIEGLPHDHRLRASENVYAFSANLASLEVLQFLLMVIAPLGMSDVGEWNFHFVNGRMDVAEGAPCEDYCVNRTLVADGDRAPSPTAEHPAAERERSRRASMQDATPTPDAGEPNSLPDRFRRGLWQKLPALLRARLGARSDA